MKWFARVVFAMVLVLTGTVTASAQTNTPAAGPLMGSEADQSALGAGEADAAPTPEPAGAAVRIVVVGDAIAGGLGAGMTRMAQADATLEIVNRFNESSGLARPELYDWPGALSALLAAKPAQAVVVLVGVNDRQTIRDGNIRFPFRTPGWIAAYEKQVDRLIAAAQSAGAKVYWVGIPPMAQAQLDGDMQALTAIHAARAKALGAQLLDVRKAFVTADGSYTDVGPDDTGETRKLRARDGVTFMKQGNNRFGQLVLEAIKADLALAAPAAATPETPAPAPVAPSAAAGPAPTFGQAGLDGEVITFRADEVKIADAASAAATPIASATFALSPKAGSQAEQLLIKGIVPVAPAGRFDDFSEPPPAQ